MEVYTWWNAQTKRLKTFLLEFPNCNDKIISTTKIFLQNFFFSYSKILENKWSILVENLIQHKPLISEKWGGPYHLLKSNFMTFAMVEWYLRARGLNSFFFVFCEEALRINNNLTIKWKFFFNTYLVQLY